MTIYKIRLIALLSLMLSGQVALASEFSLETRPLSNSGIGELEILAVDDAFSLRVLRHDDMLEILWQIRPGHYLYRHRLAVNGSDNLGIPLVPSGQEKQDEYFGDVEVYYESLIVEVPLESTAEEKITIEYQGCAEAGICYPPQKRQFIL